MKKIYLFSLLVLSTMFGIQSIYGQQTNYNSATYDELLKLRSFYSFPIEKWDSLRCAIYGECITQSTIQKQQTSILQTTTCNLNKRMFGWHSAGSSSSSYIWNSISDLSYFSYDVNPSTGAANNSTQINNWATDAVIIAAHTNNVKVHLTVTLFNNTTEFSTFFGSTIAQTTLKNNLVSAVIAANAKGINIDFEGSGLSSTYLTQFISFISGLSTQLHNSVPNSELSIDLMATQTSASFLSQLNSFVDLFIIMGYDYYWGSQNFPGPVAPLYDFPQASGMPYSYGSVSNSINDFLKTLSSNKLILAIPYYGRGWNVSNGCTIPGIGSSSAVWSLIYSYYKQDPSFSTTLRDINTFNAYYCYNSSGNDRQAFFDDIYSYQKKYNVIKQRGLAGVAVWKLGSDVGYSDLWNLINNNLSICPNIPSTDTIYDMGGPQGNYHNNEDYTFTIEPPNATTVTLNFLSFDIENGYDYLKIYNGSNTSSPLLVSLSGSSLPSPVIASSGKMTIQFHSDGATTKSGYKAVYNCSTGNPCIAPTIPTLSNSPVITAPNSTSFTVTPSGGTTPYTYQWQVCTGGSCTWTNLTNNSIYSGVTTTTLNIISTTISMNGYQYRCNVYSGSPCSSYFTSSNAATLNVNAATTNYTINTSSNPAAGGTTTGGGIHASGQQITLTATNNTGYTFVNWTENSNQVTTNASYVFNVTSNRNLVANFTNCSYTLNSYSTNVSASATSGAFWVYTSNDCSWTASTNGCSWVTLTNSSGTGYGLVTFNVTANTSTSSRSCIITAGGQSFTFLQLGYVTPCSNPPSDPYGLSAYISNSNQISLSWNGTFTNVTQSEIERSLSPSGPFTLIGYSTNYGSYIDNNVIGGTTYYYRVKACCNSNCSNYTNIANLQACTFSSQATGVIATSNSICHGDSVTLTAQGGFAGTGANWIWRSTSCSAGTIVGYGSSITIAPAITTLFTVRPQGGNCMTAMNCAITTITVNQSPNASIISPNGPTTFCSGGIVKLSGNNGGIWNIGVTTDSIIVNTSGDYFVTNTNSCGSINSNHFLVTVNPLPIPVITPYGIVSFCSGDTVTLSVNLANSYLWSNNATSQNISVSTPGYYSVTITDINGCSATSSKTVLQNSPQNNLSIVLKSDTLLSPYIQPNNWYLVGNPIPVGYGLLYLCNQTGNYFVVGEDTNGCTAKSDTLFVNCTVGIEKIITTLKEIQIYPNPTNDKITIETNINIEQKFEIMNLLGQTIYKSYINKKATVNMSDFPSGVYIIKLFSDKETVVKKFIKQ